MFERYRNQIGLLALAAFAGVLLARARPARVAYARVTSHTPGAPPIAHVALGYGAGMRPDNLVVDVAGAGCSGSATLDGRQLFVEIPLDGQPSGPLGVTVTGAYRVLGRTLIRTQTFE